jgi:hypothetical protein
MRHSLALGAALAFICAAASIGIAQAPTAIYVQYEGFVKNPDNTLTLSFGYFNLNDTDTVIPAGEKNGFTPAPADRGQPTTFLKGRHRFACVMIEPEGFDGNVRWHVQSGDAATLSITTAKVLDSNYALEDRSATEAVRGLGPGKPTKGRCAQATP